jgi:hypothetical protein
LAHNKSNVKRKNAGESLDMNYFYRNPKWKHHKELVRFNISGGIHEYAVKEDARKRKRVEEVAAEHQQEQQRDARGREAGRYGGGRGGRGDPTTSGTGKKYQLVGKIQ